MYVCVCVRYLAETQQQLGVRNGELAALARSKVSASDGPDRAGRLVVT